MSVGLSSSGHSKGGSVSLPFHLLETAAFFGFWPLSIFKASDLIPLISASAGLIFFSDADSSVSFPCKDPCNYIGSTGIIQDNLPSSRSLTKAHLLSPLAK